MLITAELQKIIQKPESFYSDILPFKGRKMLEINMLIENLNDLKSRSQALRGCL